MNSLSQSFKKIQIKWAIVNTFVAVCKLSLLPFLYQQENQEDLGLWEEKFGKFVDIKANGKIETGIVLKQIILKMAT